MECHKLFFREQHVVPVIPELSSPHWSTPTTGWDRIPSAAKRVVDLEGNNTNGTRNLSGRCRGSYKFTLPKSNSSSPPETDGRNFAV